MTLLQPFSEEHLYYQRSFLNAAALLFVDAEELVESWDLYLEGLEGTTDEDDVLVRVLFYVEETGQHVGIQESLGVRVLVYSFDQLYFLEHSVVSHVD